ncbi:MAG: ABC transporter ATP-binding protein [Candidatus Atribacteria bacterium]|nr:ABC transporter ATP-binding protein [Candidatus Atribacteria bacterium]
MSTILVKNLKKYYENVKAVDGINLEAKNGEFVVLLGPSGCGKTTTLRCIAGLEIPSEGSIFFDEKEVTRLTPSDRNVGMVFQFYALYPHLRVRDNITFPLRAQRVPLPKIQKKLQEVVQIFQLENLLKRKARDLPPGDQQRVALARAVIREPNVLLLDEPLSALDEKFREEMRSGLGSLQKRIGITTIYVTHDQREAMALGDVIVVMKEGSIIQHGTPEELYEHPRTVFVGHFLGTPGMNFSNCSFYDHRLSIEGTNYSLPLQNEGLLSALQGYFGKELILGIRPEYVKITEKSDEDGYLTVKVLVIEPAGRFRLVDFMLGEKIFRTRIGWDLSIGTGQDIQVKFMEEKICIFDRKTEIALR